MDLIAQEIRTVQCLAPVADAFAGTVYPEAIDMKNAAYIVFTINKGVGTTGTSTVSVVAGDTTSPLNETAIPFYYRRVAGATSIPGALTAAAAAGFTTTAGSAEHYEIHVSTKAMASTGYAYCSLKLVEVVDSPVVGSVTAVVYGQRYADSTDNIID